MVRKVFGLVLAALFLVSIAACQSGNRQEESPPASSSNGSNGTQTESPSSPASEEPKEPVKITLSHSQGEWIWPVLEDLAKKYNEQSGNTVELMYVPAASYNDWVKAQFIAGSAPDIMWGGFPDKSAMSDALKNKWIIDVTAYFDEVSPYTGAPWKESYLDGMLDGTFDPNLGNAMLGVPLLIGTVNLYYNKDIFREIGLPEAPPATWSEIIEIGKKIKESGKDIIPFSVQNSIDWNLDWQRRAIMNDLWDDVVATLDIITPNGTLEIAEQALGVKSGVIDPADPRMIDYFNFMKEFAKYLNKGFNTASWEFEGLFNEGKSAMTMNGSWYPNQVVTSGITVNYGIGPVPYVDKGVSQASPGVFRKFGLGAGEPAVFVSQQASDEGRADAAIDFLRYLSDPQTGAKDFIAGTMFLPVVKDVEVPEVMNGIVDNIGTEKTKIPMWSIHAFTSEQAEKARVMFQAFYENNATAEQFVEQFKPFVLEYTDQAIKEHPEWKVEEFLEQVKK